MGIAAAFRIVVYVFLILNPIPNEQGALVSPLLEQKGIDFMVYRFAADRLVEGWPDPSALMSFRDPSTGRMFPVPGALLPVLLIGFAYGPGNTLPLSLLFLGMGIGLSSAWIWWLWRQGLRAHWLALFAVLPGPVWFSVNISTDLLFACVVGWFFLAHVHGGTAVSRWAWGYAAAAVSLLIRPNGLGLFLYLLLRQVPHWRRPVVAIAVLATAAVGAVAFVVYYQPYLGAYALGIQVVTYWGFSQSAYLHGIFDVLPGALNLIASWFALSVAKAMYFTGLRPSYGTTESLFVLARAAPGLILLPGLVWAFVRGTWAHRLFLGVYLLPFALGVAQDRYNLPILPILFLYGVLFIEAAARKARGLAQASGPRR